MVRQAHPFRTQATPAHCTDRSILRWGNDFSPAENQAVGGINISDYSCVPFNDRRHTVVQAGAGTFSAVTWEVRCHLRCQLCRFRHTWRTSSAQSVVYEDNGTTVTVNRFTDHPELAVMNMIHVITTSCEFHTRPLRCPGARL